MIEVYTDGTITKNPGGKGRAGYVIKGTNNVVISPIISSTTNNRMELLGILLVLTDLPVDSELVIYTDSMYCVGAFKKRNSKTKVKKNKDLIEQMWLEANRHKNVEVNWVRGHDGNEWNELVDKAIRITDVNQ